MDKLIVTLMILIAVVMLLPILLYIVSAIVGLFEIIILDPLKAIFWR